LVEALAACGRGVVEAAHRRSGWREPLDAHGVVEVKAADDHDPARAGRFLVGWHRGHACVLAVAGAADRQWHAPAWYVGGMQIDAVIEIPKGTRNKYEADEDGNLWLDRTLFTSTVYPEDYGHVDGTLAEDGDPIDVLVLLEEPTFPGCRIHVRLIGIFNMSDEAGRDEKLLCVPATDARWSDITELEHVSTFRRDAISHFFKVYKDLEPGKHVEPGDWAGRAEAEAAYEASVRRFKEQ